MNCQDVDSGIKNSGFTFGIWAIAFVMFAVIFHFFPQARAFAVNKYVMLANWAIVIVLNLYSYYQNPARLSNETVCGFPGIPITCRLFNAVTASFALAFDCLTLFFLLQNFTSGDLKFNLILPGTIFAIGQLFIWMIYHSEASVSDQNFQFLPVPLSCKPFRIFIYAMIMILDILAFWQGFMEGNVEMPLHNWKGMLDSRFGGWKGSKMDKLNYVFGFGSAVVAMFLDFFALDSTIQYTPKDFNLPEFVL